MYERIGLEGWSCRRVAEEMNALGVPPAYVRDDRLGESKGKRRKKTKGIGPQARRARSASWSQGIDMVAPSTGALAFARGVRLDDPAWHHCDSSLPPWAISPTIMLTASEYTAAGASRP